MDISRHRYFYDRIAENEMNDRNRDEIRRRMIPFPYIDSVMVRQNSDSVSGHDYIYNYVYSLPVGKPCRYWKNGLTITPPFA